MSGTDWLVVMVLVCFVVAVCVADRLRDLDERWARRLDEEAKRERLLRELDRQP